MSDGTQITFNSGGYETATIDLNNNHVTFSYRSFAATKGLARGKLRLAA